MGNGQAFRIVAQIPRDQTDRAVALFWQAFRPKLSRVLRPEGKALRFFSVALDPAYGIGAINPSGKLIGMAGYKSSEGALVGGTEAQLRGVFGRFGGLWRGVALSLLERPVEADVLLMDGIAVDASARGQGVGTALLDAVKERAVVLGKSSIRLDVIDTNPKARALYERQGFVAGATQNTGLFAPLFGFQRATTMRFSLPTATGTLSAQTDQSVSCPLRQDV